MARAKVSHFVVDETPAEAAGDIPDIIELSNLWESAGVSFGKEETFVLFLSIKHLVEERGLKSVRLWGKIFGLNANYIVVEAEAKETEDEGEAQNDADANEGQEPPADDGLPKPKVLNTPALPKEVRAGVNKYAYYVTNQGMHFTNA